MMIVLALKHNVHTMLVLLAFFFRAYPQKVMGIADIGVGGRW